MEVSPEDVSVMREHLYQWYLAVIKRLHSKYELFIARDKDYCSGELLGVPID